MEIKTIKVVAWLSALLFMGNVSVASAVVLTFEGLNNLERVGEFYNGGKGSDGSVGPDYDIVFGGSAGVTIDSDAGGSGNFANEPSPDTVVEFPGGPTNAPVDYYVMNALNGFTSGFSFYYSSGAAGTVTVYDAADAAGNILGTLSLTANYQDNNCTGDPTGDYCNWDPIGITFTGTARSVSFLQSTSFTFFDNITIGSEIPGGEGVPEPTTLALLGLGIAGIANQRRKRLAA